MNLIAFLQSKFGGHVISNKTDIPTPPKSPDLNPLFLEQNLPQLIISSALGRILQKIWIQISSEKFAALQD